MRSFPHAAISLTRFNLEVLRGLLDCPKGLQTDTAAAVRMYAVALRQSQNLVNSKLGDRALLSPVSRSTPAYRPALPQAWLVKPERAYPTTRHLTLQGNAKS